jgi:hypothetical protein
MRPELSDETVERLTYMADVHADVQRVRTSSVEECLIGVLDRFEEEMESEDETESVDAEQLRRALAEEGEEEPTGSATGVSVGRSGDWM